MDGNNKGSAVLLVTYNRIDYTRQVIDKIKSCNLRKLYIFNDGARKDGDKEISKQIKELIDSVNWNCEVVTWFSEKNMGCGFGPSGAISWVLETEESVIILEDDCVPSDSFFDFCNHNLEKYKDDDRVGAIVGRSHHDVPELFQGDSYVFSHYGFTWGWATWKRVWDKYDIEMKSWPDFEKQGGFINTFFSMDEVAYFNAFYKDKYIDKNLKKHVWDYQFFYLMYTSNFLFVVPSKNLVENIGYVGEHFQQKMKEHTIKAVENFKIEKEPLFVQPNRQYDFYYFKRTIKQQPLYRRVIYKLKNYFDK